MCFPVLSFHVMADAPRTETLIPPQRDRWKRKLLKKAASSDIAYWFVCLFVCLFFVVG